MEILKSELDYQKPIWAYLLSQKNFTSTSKSKISIINNGNINPYEGPDLKNLCIISNNHLKICDAEIDIKSSNWFSHKHYCNPNFNDVILHIVFEDNQPTNLETLILNPEELPTINTKNLIKLNNIELEEYSLARLKRKSNVCSQYLMYGLRYAWSKCLSDFINSIKKKRVRPKTINSLSNLFQTRYNHRYYIFLLNKRSAKLNTQELFELHNKKFYLSSEIFLNCLLPLLLSFNKGYANQVYTVWWSLKASNKYGILKNRFPHFSQEYTWQQQGMKEFLLHNNEEKHLIK